MIYFQPLFIHIAAMTRLSESMPPVAPGVKPRARERVLAYLEAQFERGDLPQGARLPSGRALAGQLGVSVSTVQSVFQMLTREGVISTEIGNGSFLLKAPKTDRQTLRLGVTFGSLTGSPAVDLWHLHISGAMVNHLARMDRESHIVPMTMLDQTGEQARQTLENYRHRVDGVILRPVEGLAARLDRELLEEVAVVHLNPPALSATADFVSADFMDTWYRIGKALLGAGRRRIVNLSNFHEQIGVSNLLRHAGLTAAIGIRTGREVSYEMVNAIDHHEEHGYCAAGQIFAKGREWPDAVVATGDELALGVLRYCRENGIRVPHDVSVIGGSGTHPASSRHLTTACQPMQAIGVELVEMLCRKIDARRHRRNPVQTGVYLPMTFSGGGTTLPAENELLGIAASGASTDR